MGTGPPSISRQPSPYRRRTPKTNGRSWPAVVGRGQPANARGLGGGLSTVVLTDIYGSAQRDHQSQRRMRQDMYEIVRDVVRYVGLDLDSLHTTDTGDGLRLLLPFSALEPIRVVDTFVLGLSTGLSEHRRYVAEAARIRMRLAFDFGHVEPHLRGWTGEPLVRVARLIEAKPLRAALAADDRIDLATVVSDGFFETVVRHGHGYVRPSCFREIQVNVKEFAARAWQLGPGTAGACGCCYGIAA
jgi:hypothetical protein